MFHRVSSAPVGFNAPVDVNGVAGVAAPVALASVSLEATHPVHGNLRVTREATQLSDASPSIRFDLKLEGAPLVSATLGRDREGEIDGWGNTADTFGYWDIDLQHLGNKGVGAVAHVLFAETANELGVDYFTIRPVTPNPTVEGSPMGRLCRKMGMEALSGDGFKCEPGELIRGATKAALDKGWVITGGL